MPGKDLVMKCISFKCIVERFLPRQVFTKKEKQQKSKEKERPVELPLAQSSLTSTITDNTISQNLAGGIFVMANWGKVSFNKSQGAWCVKGQYQGERVYYSTYRTDVGPRTCQTEQEALLLQVIISSEMKNGNFNPLKYKRSKPLHLKKYALQWLEKIKPSVKYATYKTYRAAINNWLIPILGDVFLPDVRYDHYFKLWTDIKQSEKYRKNIITCLYAIMEDAKRAGHISQVPDKIVFKGKFTMPRKDPAWIEKETQELILQEIKPEDRPIFQFIFITGVRPSEARALQKSDIHKEQGYISIRYTMAPVEAGGEELKEVKQKKERRIPYYEALDAVIPKNIGMFVFVNPRTGRPYTKNINRDIWAQACKDAKVKIRLNEAGRHSYGNQLAEMGVDMETISHGLGHSTTATTKAFYANPSLNILKKAVDNMRMLKKKEEAKK
jgi:integrase